MGKIVLLQVLLCASILGPNLAIGVNSTDSLNRSKRRVFDDIRTGLDETELAYEIAKLSHQTSKKAVAICSEVDGWFRIWCASEDDDIGGYHVYSGWSMIFSFTPKTVFWCTLDLRHFWARWDVYNNSSPYINAKDKVYRYIVRSDGVYTNGKKISSLESGKHRYILWEHYNDGKHPYGTSLTGYVDSGICNNLPEWMDDKASAVTVCDHKCVILYEDLHCGGYTSRLKAQGLCTDFWLTYFNDRISSIKGC